MITQSAKKQETTDNRQETTATSSPLLNFLVACIMIKLARAISVVGFPRPASIVASGHLCALRVPKTSLAKKLSYRYRIF